ncbi:hypothetical protein LTR56_019683 [Elasticomyces elasticus]|nr:hypothetical protein LTR56_019683 [Elasticomyces elasticus]KAK3633984.1 hypothetical protein LTR22_019851 [Elasticomyces elasticus]KAK4911121.1 hypothetical protein LTR49_020288 [Elasticomyces elasticus]KAK5750651.1 hypothetical protein LTS12_019272 [Elasticomyces elasticus]
MNTTGAEALPKAEADAVYCCTRNFRDGLQSGLVGSLLKYGYTDENRRLIVKAFNASCDILIYLTGQINDYPEIKDHELGQIVVCGLDRLIHKFGVAASNRNTCHDLIGKFETMELGTIGQTLSLSCLQEAAEEMVKVEEERKRAFEAAQVTFSTYGGAFGGTGGHIEGLWSFGNCIHPGWSQ